MNLQNFLSEATRSFYVKGNRVIFTRGQEHFSTDITRCGPKELAELIATICIVNAFADLSRKGNEPSTEEVAEEAHSYNMHIKWQKKMDIMIPNTFWVLLRLKAMQAKLQLFV